MQEFLEGEQFEKMAREYNAKYQTAQALQSTQTIVEQALDCFLSNKPFVFNTQKQTGNSLNEHLGYNLKNNFDLSSNLNNNLNYSVCGNFGDSLGDNAYNKIKKEDDALIKLHSDLKSDALKNKVRHLLFDLQSILKPNSFLVLRWQKQAYLKVEELQKVFAQLFEQF